MRHAEQGTPGELADRLAPHSGQTTCFFLRVRFISYSCFFITTHQRSKNQKRLQTKSRILGLVLEGVEQILDFRVYVGRIINRLPDLSAKKLSKSLPHPMYGDFCSDFRHP
jgi:hypothetical protein